MADAELWLEIFNAIGCHKLEHHDTGYYPILEGEDWGTDAPILTDSAHDIIAMHAMRGLVARGWTVTLRDRSILLHKDTVFASSGLDGFSPLAIKWAIEHEQKGQDDG